MLQGEIIYSQSSLIGGRVIQTTKSFGRVDSPKTNFCITVEYMLLFGRCIFLAMFGLE